MLRFCVLASGSSGNCAYVATDTTGVLVDAGLSARETVRRLAGVGVAPATLRGVLITHEHSDHTQGLSVLHRRHGLALYANRGTIEGCTARAAAGEAPLAWNVFTTGAAFDVGDLRIEPFSVPHDAYDPVGFLLHGDGATLGIATDMGISTILIRERLRRCDAIVLESNHDVYLLRQSDRPWPLKQRILGPQGHLSNEHCAEMVAELAAGALQVVVLAHLSRECNHPQVALRATVEGLQGRGAGHVRVLLASADVASEVVTVTPRAAPSRAAG